MQEIPASQAEVATSCGETTLTNGGRQPMAYKQQDQSGSAAGWDRQTITSWSGATAIPSNEGTGQNTDYTYHSHGDVGSGRQRERNTDNGSLWGIPTCPLITVVAVGSCLKGVKNACKAAIACPIITCCLAGKCLGCDGKYVALLVF
uniref:Uncharacterized protein n=1 Tax=Kwoniella bestiolae CBS 10118 TaxID=1296100 RepID=A0A1B9GDD0_9TREE|nr:hypothetical protein I302_00519 [Kwoniella bestiolae CBS 10118]OCF29028.1 hypothetical protein I302_00519 [Kwoniella bestiolae CBS 10118]